MVQHPVLPLTMRKRRVQRIAARLHIHITRSPYQPEIGGKHVCLPHGVGLPLYLNVFNLHPTKHHYQYYYHPNCRNPKLI
jgi:hypothetical protein